MTEPSSRAGDPRWGQEGREAKAEAIVRTLQSICGASLPRNLWMDIGCGSGGIAAALAAFADRVVGVDPESWERWTWYRERHPNVDFHAGGYRDLAAMIGRECCDVVVCNQVYEHVDNPRALLESIYHALKPGGVCYFAGPNLLWPIEPHVHWPCVHWLPRRFAQWTMHVLGSRRASELDAYSTHYWRLMRWFREVGYTVSPAVSARLACGLDLQGWQRPLPRLVARAIDALAPFSPGLVFVLRKP